jgi:hypothetical protein
MIFSIFDNYCQMSGVGVIWDEIFTVELRVVPLISFSFAYECAVLFHGKISAEFRFRALGGALGPEGT